MNHFFVLAENRKDALTFLEKKGHISNRNLARISEAKGSDWAVDMTKFFSSAAQASTNRAQGIVKNMDGFAVMQNGGGIFMPLSVVQP